MRPEKLTIQAIGPFANLTVIDFSRVQKGLFLIAGATGSGKSTIFDAIVYALFGEKSAESRRAEGTALVSHFAGDEIEPFVEFIFSHQGKSYKVRRSPARTRPKKRGSGTTEVPAKAVLFLPYGQVVEQIRQVDEAVKALLGVDAARFRQLYMLPQGEFARILNASSSERQEIFRTVFGTAYIEVFTDDLKARASEARAERRALDQKILIKAAELPPPELLDKAKDVNEAVEAESVDALLFLLPDLKEDLALLSEQHVRLKADVDAAAKADLSAEQALKQAERDDEAFTELEKALRKSEALKAKESEFQAVEERWRTAKRAKEEVASLYKAKEEARTRAEQLETRKTDLTAQKEQAEIRLQAGSREEETLLASRPDESFDLEKLTLLKAEVEAFRQLETIEKQLHDLGAELKAAEEKEAAAAKQAGERKVRLQELESRRESYAETKICVNTLDAEKKILSAAKDDTNALLTRLQDRRNIAALLQQASSNLKEAVLQHSRIEQELYEGQAGELAARLTEGEPCPVCGSRSHPCKAARHEKQVSRKMLNEAAAAVEDVRNSCQQLSGQLAAADAKNDEILSSVYRQLGLKKDAYGSLSDFVPDGLIGLIGEKIAGLNERLASAGAKLKQLELEQKMIRALEKEEEECVASAGTLSRQMEQLRVKIAGLEGQKTEPLKRLRHDSAAAAAAAYSALDAALKKFAEDKKAVAKKIDQEKRALDKLTAKLSELAVQAETTQKELAIKEQHYEEALIRSAFDDEATFLAALLEDEELLRLERTIADYRKQTEAAAIELKRTTKQAEGKTKPDLEAARLKRKECRERLGTLRAEASAFKAKLDRWLDTLSALEQFFSERSEKQGIAEELTELSEVAAGNLKGADKRTFESFVQMNWFSEVVFQANQRLSVMSENRFQLVARSDSRSQGAKSGLDLDVFDAYTGRERAADTLSGGETFLASLALALGLSDVVSARAGGSEVDCLFVDEGFGSLDDAALGQAIRTLSDLTGDHRLIGIISHVGELKRAIPRQLLVEKRPEGSRVEWRGL